MLQSRTNRTHVQRTFFALVLRVFDINKGERKCQNCDACVHVATFMEVYSDTEMFTKGAEGKGAHRCWVPVARATELCPVAPSVCGPSKWNFLHVYYRSPRILRCLLDFWNIFAALLKRISGLNRQLKKREMEQPALQEASRFAPFS